VEPQSSDERERRLAAILSADVAGYSRLMAEDEAATVRRVAAYRDEIILHVRQHRGRVVDSPGDNLLAEFPSALDATRCAIEVQRVLGARNTDLPPERRMEFRIGVHVGDVVAEGGRIYGDGVNLAARVERLAEPGGVSISRAVYEQVRDRLSLAWEDLGEQELKNLPHPVRVYRARPGYARADAGVGAPAEVKVSGGSDIAVFVVPAVWVAYLAIVFEILFMISPFALYYYSAYGPSLNLFHRSAWTVWLTQFFLPHFSETSSVVLNELHAAGFPLVFLGAAIFAIGFVQVYWAKLHRRAAVTAGLYRFSRHPQYVGLAVVGLGTLLIWPRFLVLVMYVTMLFLYGFLARFEERRCLERFGESYRLYLQRTQSRFPHAILAKLRDSLPSFGGRKAVALLVLYAAVLAGSIALAYGVRDYSLSKVAGYYEDDMAVISPAFLTDEELMGALRIASGDARVEERIEAAGRDAKLVVYVVPLEWELPDIPIEVLSGEHGGHYTPRGFDRNLYKVLFTKARTHDPAARGVGIVKAAYGRDPIVLVKVSRAPAEVTGIETPPPTVRWGDIPTPLF
jgi:class 3 adenylate cyclase/protein-S-isoprenylcysteine O-methyltransferase Ste14